MTKAGAHPTPSPADKPGSKAARVGTGSHPKVSGPLSGRKIGPYRVTDQIGKGGMGVVYRAHDMTLDRTVAIKILPGHLSGDEEFIKRFVREARSAARLDHPNIVQVFQAGRMVSEGAGGPGPCFIAMQYFDGRPLSELISGEGRLEPARALGIARQVAEALAAAHAAGIIHRDIKSSNILVAADDRVKVADFGLATCMTSEGRRITQTGAYLGTPEYSSPEQCEGAELDGRSDIYSLGVVLYEMLTGRVPFEAATPLKLFDRIVHEAPEPLSRVQAGLPRELCALVGKMLAKRREERHATAEELLSAMRRVRVALGSWKRAPGTGLRRPVGSRGAGFRLAAATGSIVLLGLAAFAIYRFSRSGAAIPPADPSQQVATPIPATTVLPTPQSQDLGVVIFDLSSRFDAKDEKRLSWVRSGVPDMLITELKQCPGLEVFSRDSAAEALKSAGGQDHGAAAKQLGARLVVSGSLYAVGGKLRIDLCVADTVTGKVADAVKDEGTEDGIFELVDSLGRKLRASFDSLVAAHRGGSQPLAALEVRSTEQCLFLAMASPADRSAAPGRGGGGAGLSGVERLLAKQAEQLGEREMKSEEALRQRERHEVTAELTAKQEKRKAGQAGPGYTEGRGKTIDKGVVGKSKEYESDADVLQDLAKADDKGVAAMGDAPRVARKPGVSESWGSAGLPVRPSAPAASSEAPRTASPVGSKVPALAPAPAAAGPAGEGAVDGRKLAAGVAAPAEKKIMAEAKVGGATESAAKRAARVEAMRRYYTGLSLLREAESRSDFSAVLAELTLARSLAPELVVVNEAIERAGRGLDAAPAE